MMDQQLTRIEEKIDQLVEKAGITHTQLAVHSQLHKQNTDDLAHHIKRTDLLQKQMETALLPIKVAKFSVIAASGAGAIYTFIKMLIGN